MKISKLSWLQVEKYLQHDDRCVLPLGSIEQHAYLSLATDMILAERIAEEAAEPLGVPVFPAVPYGLAPYFQAYPGSVTLRVDTYVSLVRDILASLQRTGFRRVLIVNGHGGNQPAAALAQEFALDHPELLIRFHNWYNAPATAAAVQAVDTLGTHGSWMESFPWTRVAGVEVPTGVKEPFPLQLLRSLPPAELRSRLGDGNCGGAYEHPVEAMLGIWDTAVTETRALLEGDWRAA